MRTEPLSRFLITATLLLAIPNLAASQDSMNLSLPAAIATAQQNNPGLIALKKEVGAEKGRAWTTWWLADPRFSIEWEGVPAGSGLSKFGERKLRLSQGIEFPTNILWRSRFAAREVEAAEMRYEQGKLEIRASAFAAYIQFLAARDGLALARLQVSVAQEFVDKAEIRRQVGEAPAIETVRARVELARAQNQLHSAESAYASARAQLNVALGREPDRAVATSDSLTFLRFTLSLSEIKQQALADHPRLGESHAMVGAASYLRKLAWGSLLPAFEISGFQQNLDGDPSFYGVEIGLSVPLWFVFRQRGEIQQATGVLASQESHRTQIRLQLLADIESAFAAFEAVNSQAENFIATLLDQANEVYRIALRSYEEGEAGYLELLEAQQTLIAVRRDYIDTLTEYYLAIANLESASGIPIIE